MSFIHFLRAALASALLMVCPALSSAAEIVVAQIAAFSGPLAPTGLYMRAGAQLYFDSINEKGGIHGARIKFLSRDDGYKANETVRLARLILAETQPVAFLGFVGTGNVEALLKEKILEEADIPLVCFRTGAASIAGKNDPHLFLTRATYAQELEKIAQQYTSTGYSRLAILYQNDAFGLDALESAEQAVKKTGGTLVAKGSYEKNTVNVEEAVKNIAAAEPQAVIMIANTAASAAFLQQSRAAGNMAQYVALSVTDGPQVAQLIGAEKAHGLALTQVVPDPENRSIPLIREIQEAFRKFNPQGVTINHTFIEGYLGAKTLGEALFRAGPNAGRKKLRDTLEGLRSHDAGGIDINFSPGKHSGSNFVDITILNRSGKLLR